MADTTTQGGQLHSLPVMSAAEMIQRKKFRPKFLVIGESGGGKTTALTTLPQHLKILHLDFFGNPESLEGAPNIEIIRYGEWDPRDPVAYTTLMSHRQDIVRMLDKKTFPWDVLSLDTLTGLTRFIELYVIATNPEHKMKHGAPGEYHYRGIAHLVSEFVMSFLSYPVATVMTAHTDYYQDQSSGISRYFAALVGKKARNTIYSYFGEVYRAFAEPDAEKGMDKFGQAKMAYWWQTAPDTYWPMLKSVMNTRGQYWGRLVPPDFSALFEKRGVKLGREEG